MRLRSLLLMGSLPFLFVGALTVAALAVDATSPSDTTRWPAVAGNDLAPVTDTPAREPVTGSAINRQTQQRGSNQDELHQDYNMTRYMSGPDASGPMFTGQVTDPQLHRSSDPAYVHEIERHQQEMDRMLGLGAP